MDEVRSCYEFGDWTVEPALNQVSRGDSVYHLETRSMDVLIYLLEHPDEVVSTEILLERLWPGRVVEQSTIHRQINQIRRVLGDDSKQPRYIRTIVKRGYQVVAPVRRLTDQTSVGESDTLPRSRRWSLRGVAGVAVVAALIVLILYLRVGGVREAPSREGSGSGVGESTAVLVEPFEDLSDDGDLTGFAAIVQKEIFGVLAKNQALRLISLTSPPTAVGYGVQGSVWETEGKIAVSVQVVRLEDRVVLWEDAFFQERRDGLDAAEYVGRLAGAVIGMQSWFVGAPAEAAEAVKFIIAGQTEIIKNALGGNGDLRASVIYFERSIQERDRFFPLGQLAIVFANRLNQSIAYEQARPAAVDYICRAVAAVPERLKRPGFPLMPFQVAIVLGRVEFDYPAAMWNLEQARKYEDYPLGVVESEIASLLTSQGRLDEAITSLETALTMYSHLNDMGATLLMGRLYLIKGQYAEAVRWLERGLAISPTGTTPWGSELILVEALFLAGEEVQAIALLDRTWERFGGQQPELFAAVLALVGRDQQSRQILASFAQKATQGELVNHSTAFLAHYRLQELDQALVWLERAVENREYWLFPSLKAGRELDPLRDDPRFKRIMARLAEIESSGGLDCEGADLPAERSA